MSDDKELQLIVIEPTSEKQTWQQIWKRYEVLNSKLDEVLKKIHERKTKAS